MKQRKWRFIWWFTIQAWNGWCLIRFRLCSLAVRTRGGPFSIYEKNRVLSSRFEIPSILAFVSSSSISSEIPKILWRLTRNFATRIERLNFGEQFPVRKSVQNIFSKLFTIRAVRKDTPRSFSNAALKFSTDFNVATKDGLQRKILATLVARLLSLM